MIIKNVIKNMHPSFVITGTAGLGQQRPGDAGVGVFTKIELIPIAS